MTRGSTLPAVGPGEHAVHFYGTDDELAATVGDFLSAGIRAGDGVLVIATPPHWRAFEAALAAAGIDVAAERQAGRLLAEDARELLALFLGSGGLDAERFLSVMSGLVRRAAAGGRPVRIYGEMVSVLWDAGHVALAIDMEDRWNGLGARIPFTLLCGYPSRVLSNAATAAAAREVCRLHSDVIAVSPGDAGPAPGDAGAGGEPGDPGDAGPVVGTRSFAAELDSVRAARHFVTGLLDSQPGDPLADDAAIVVTELASNAVLHAHSGFTLTISRAAAALRIAVRDNRPLSPGSDGLLFHISPGHGLSVVAQLASHWAVQRLPDGKVVWAELFAG
jgi:anti-sigma regulatory factor (Ser/Thr protein kinase)